MGCMFSNALENPNLLAEKEKIEINEPFIPSTEQNTKFEMNTKDCRFNNNKPHYLPLPGVVPVANTSILRDISMSYEPPQSVEYINNRMEWNQSQSLCELNDNYRKESHGTIKNESTVPHKRHNIRRRRSLKTAYVALFDYESRSDQDMSFRKGDLMKLLDENEGSDWRQAEHLSAKTIALVPSVYIAKNGSLQSKDWYFDKMSRREAETLLLSDENIVGTFMVRRSEKSIDLYSLSIKCKTREKGVHAKHYRTRFDEKKKFCLFPEKYFQTLPKLIDYYSKNCEKLPSCLIKPCPKPIPQLWDLAPELAEQWEISKSELKLIRNVGSGQFGEVWYGKWNETIDVAIKTCKPEFMTSENFLAEAAIMKRYRHPRLVALYAVCTTQQPIYIVTEYMKNGSLLEYMKKNASNIFFNHLIYIALQIAEGMNYLEGNQLVHRDLAARNILIGENNSAKIADFGLARVMSRDATCKRDNKPEILPIKWSALEVIDNNEYSTKSDVWSFGILMMELFTYGEKPYGDWTTQYTIHQLKKGYRIPRPQYMPEVLYKNLYKCWDIEPMQRPTFEYLREYFEAYTIGTEGQYQDETVTYVNQEKSSKKERRKQKH